MVTGDSNSFGLAVEVAYASPQQSCLIPVKIEEGATIKQVIERSGLLEQCPIINLEINKVGLFSKIISLDTLVRAGDRIEIYRPLILEPKEARRLRAEKVKQKN